MLILEFLVKRLAQGALIICITSFIIFTLLRVVPGDPVRIIVGGMAPPDVVEKVATKMGLRDPILVQFARYMGRPAAGRSRAVLSAPAQRLIATGGQYIDADQVRHGAGDRPDSRAPAADAAARRPGAAVRAADLVSARHRRRACIRTLAGPAGLRAAVDLRVAAEFLARPRPDPVPVRQAQTGCRRSAIRASPTRSCRPSCWRSSSPRSSSGPCASFGEVMQASFIDGRSCAACRGGRSSTRHVLRNASIPMLNLFGVQIGGLLLGGVFVVEYIFDYPGIGKLTDPGGAAARLPDHPGRRHPGERRLRPHQHPGRPRRDLHRSEG